MPDTIARVSEVSRGVQLAEYMKENTDVTFVAHVIPYRRMPIKLGFIEQHIVLSHKHLCRLNISKTKLIILRTVFLAGRN